MSLGGNSGSKDGSAQTMPTGNIKNSVPGSRIAPGTSSFYTVINNGSPAPSSQNPIPEVRAVWGSGMSSAQKNVSQANIDVRSASSVSNPYDDARSSSAGGWGPMDVRRRVPPVHPVTYNAWDDKGQLHSKQRNPSSSGMSDYRSQTPTPTSEEKQVSAPAPSPGFAQATQTPTARSSNWAKAVGDRNTRPYYNPLAIRSENAHNTRGRRHDGSELDDLQDM